MIVEDDILIAELERDFLEVEGFTVVIANDGEDALRILAEETMDAALLDIMLPGDNGFNVCREIRKNSNIPILFVTARKEDADKICGLGLGADDYIVKPFSPSELVARLKAHLAVHARLSEQNGRVKKTNEVLVIGDLRIDRNSRQVYRENQEITLTGKEFDLLLFFSEHPNCVYSKEKLFETLWGMDAIGEIATVTVHINRLRDKMNEVQPPFERIETVWGAGYRFRD